MTRMTVEWYLPIVIFILCYSKMIWNEGMRWNEGVFGEGEKNEFWDVCHSAIIPSSFRNSKTNLALDCPWNDLNDTGMTEMSREWQNNNGMMGGLMLSRGKGVWGSRPEAEVIVEPQTPFPRDSINPLPRMTANDWKEIQYIFWQMAWHRGGSGVVVYPWCQNKSIHWMMEWQKNDLNDTGMTGMSQEWQNDNEMIEWQNNDGMTK